MELSWVTRCAPGRQLVRTKASRSMHYGNGPMLKTMQMPIVWTPRKFLHVRVSIPD